MDIDTVSKIVGAGMIAASAYGIGTIKQTLVDEIKAEYNSYVNKYECVDPTEFQLELGYKGWNRKIIADMKKSPHMLVCGLSQQGKTKMVERAIQGKNVILMNAFPKDFTSIEPVERITEIDEMEHMLEYLTSVKENDEPLYVVIDEILELVMSGNKSIQKYITRLLATAAHKRIYIIAISQYAEKEIICNKHLYNTRVCFKMIEDSSYKTVLGYTPDEQILRPRTFHYLTDEKGIGYTYSV